MRPVVLSNTLAKELEALHGSQAAARAFRNRAHMAARPLDGGTVHERIVVLSDFHLGAGKDPNTGRFHPGDDFTETQSQQLVSFLAREWAAAKKGSDTLLSPTRSTVADALAGMTWLDGSPVDIGKVVGPEHRKPYALTLCLDGDIVDFLQTASERPGLPFPDGYTSDHKGPRNTPANVLVTLNMIHEGHPEVFRALATHLLLGHRIDYVPGNHDRQMYNQHVWSGRCILPNGRQVVGFTKLLEREMRAQIGRLPDADTLVQKALARLELKPFAFYADKLVEHGDDSDPVNRVRRPHREAILSSGLHDEMPLALGDYGVRGGFNDLEVLEPDLDAISSKLPFIGRALRHPRKAASLVWAFIKAGVADGFPPKTGSEQVDLAERVADIPSLVARFPAIVTQLNALRPEAEKLSEDEIVRGLQEIERRSATPFYSRFREGAGLIRRLFQLALAPIRGARDDRSRQEVCVDRLEAAHRAFNVNDIVVGHTHVAADIRYITEDEKRLRYVNTHTWLDRPGNWGRAALTWKQDGRGVGVIMIGSDERGQLWSELTLNKVVNLAGDLVPGDLLEDPEPNLREAAALARQIFAKNHGRARSASQERREQPARLVERQAE